MVNSRERRSAVAIAALACLSAASAAAQSPAVPADVAYDRFTDTTRVNAGASFNLKPVTESSRRDSINVSVIILFKGKSLATAAPARRRITLYRFRTTNSVRPIWHFDDATHLYLILNGRENLNLRRTSYDTTYSPRAYTMENVGFAVTAAQLARITTAVKVEARVGLVYELVDATPLATLAYRATVAARSTRKP